MEDEMQSQKISRRKALAGAGAAAGALAIADPALAIKAVYADASARKAEADADDQAFDEARLKIKEVDAREAEEEAKHSAQRSPARVHVDDYDLSESQLDVLGNVVAITYGPKLDRDTEWAQKERMHIRAAANRKYKVASFRPRADDTMAAVRDIEQLIMDAKAHGIEGATIKLALSMFLDREQLEEGTYKNDRGAGAAAYRVLCDLTGTDLAAEAVSVEKRAWS